MEGLNENSNTIPLTAEEDKYKGIALAYKGTQVSISSEKRICLTGKSQVRETNFNFFPIFT